MTARRGMSGHQSARAKSVEWSTPPELLAALGPFDDDVCAPDQVWDGLSREWSGSVWCNPPYGQDIGRWMARMAGHRNGVALVFARTETRWFQEYVWGYASSLLFLAGRLHFYRNGRRAEANAGAPSVLISYDNERTKHRNELRLSHSGLRGAHAFHWNYRDDFILKEIAKEMAEEGGA